MSHTGLRPSSSHLPRKTAVEAFEAEHGDQQGADAEIWGREPVQVSGRETLNQALFLGLTRHVTSSLFQGLHRQEDEGDRGPGA